MDSVRVPVLPPTGECKPFQEVLIELGSRLKLPAFVDAQGARKYRDYPDFIVRHETEPGSGIGFLAGWRGADGSKSLLGEPNPQQWEMYAKNNCVFRHELPPSYRYMRNWNRGYMEWAQRARMRRWGEPILVHLYSEVLQKFRLAAQGTWPGRQPPAHLAKRVETHFDPLPFYSAPLEVQATDTGEIPARRDHAAADGDVPLLGFAERLAAADPRAQLPVRQSAHRARSRHRGRRLAVGGVAMGPRALHGPLQRGRGAGHRVDLERDRQAAGRLGARAGGERGAQGIPAQPPHLGPPAGRHLQLGSGHRPGGLVRRARAHQPGGRGRRCGRSSRRCRAAPGTRAGRGRNGWPMSRARKSANDQAARAGHRPQRLRRLPRLRDELQAVEHLRRGGLPLGRQSLRRRSDGDLLQPRADLRGGRVPEHRDGALSEIVPALRGPAVRAGVPDRRELQARRGRHRAGGLRQVHRLQVLLVGLPLRRARGGRAPEGDEEVHAVRGPHLRRETAGSGAQARLRAGLPYERAPLRRHPRSRSRKPRAPSASRAATR